MHIVRAQPCSSGAISHPQLLQTLLHRLRPPRARAPALYDALPPLSCSRSRTMYCSLLARRTELLERCYWLDIRKGAS